MSKRVWFVILLLLFVILILLSVIAYKQYQIGEKDKRIAELEDQREQYLASGIGIVTDTVKGLPVVSHVKEGASLLGWGAKFFYNFLGEAAFKEDCIAGIKAVFYYLGDFFGVVAKDDVFGRHSGGKGAVFYFDKTLFGGDDRQIANFANLFANLKMNLF